MPHHDFPLINMVAGEKRKTKTKLNSVVPRYNEGLRDWQNLFAITRFRYIQVSLYRGSFYYYWGEENRSLYRGLRYIEVRYRFHCNR